MIDERRRWSHDCSRIGPDGLAGQYLRLFWQPIHRSAEIKPGQAKPIRIMGESYTLYRGESGTAHLTAFRCAHRGMQLSAGWVEGDRIRCRYHGWKYDEDGRCVERPGELERKCPPGIGIQSYPVREYHGLIFAYFGADETPEFPEWPEFSRDGVFEATEYGRNCNFANFLDNQLDEVHISFTHMEAFRLIPEVPTIRVEATDTAVVTYSTRPGRDMRVTEFLIPNIIRLKLPSLYAGIGPADSIVWRVPTDGGRTISFGINRYPAPVERREEFLAFKSRYDTLPPPDIDGIAEAVLRGDTTLEEAKAAMGEHDPLYDVFLEDHVTMMGQGVIRDLDHEVLGKGDVGVVAVRDLWERHLNAFGRSGMANRPVPDAAKATSGEGTDEEPVSDLRDLANIT